MPLKEGSKRKKLEERNRQALVEAALSSIAEIGIARTSVSEIIQRANLSRGMVHLHFGGKDNLLIAAVKQVGEAYYEHLQEFLADAGQRAQDRLAAIVNCDLNEKVLNRRSVNIWYAFRGEARERETIAIYTDTRDERLKHLIYRAYRELADSEGQGDSALVARDATHGTLALLEGMWTDFLLHPNAFNRAVARRIVFRFLASLFPAHFDLNGAKRLSACMPNRELERLDSGGRLS